MSELRVLVVDDEPLARKRLRRLLDETPGVACAGECRDGEEAVAWLTDRLESPADAVLLDVQMPGLSGFDVLSRVGAERMPPVVFVTAFDEYAVKAFEVCAVDYLLKPFDAERFRKALERVRERVERGRPDELRQRLEELLSRLAPKSPAAADRFLVPKGDGMVFVAAEDVDWIETQGNYVALHVGAATHLLREPLVSLEGRLDPTRFCRVRRTAIVNLARVAALKPWTRDEHVLVLTTGARVAVGRRFRERVESAILGKVAGG